MEVDISALVCATPTDFLTCGSPSTVTSTGTEKLKNLAAGDVFSTYDYLVTVTEVSGSESAGWTGRGHLELSFLKLETTALSVPLAVRFDNIHLNQCYQLMAGSKVVTEFDESWSNVVDADVLIGGATAIFSEIKDMLASSNKDTVAINKKIAELNTYSLSLQNAGFRPEWVGEQTSLIENVKTSLSCYANSSNLRTSNSCSAEDSANDINQALEAINNSTINPYFGDVFDEAGNYLANESSTSANTGNEFVIVKAAIFGTSVYEYKKLGEYNFVSTQNIQLYNSILKHYWINELNYSPGSLYNSNFTINVIGSPNLSFNSCPTCYVEPSELGYVSTLNNPNTIVAYLGRNGLIHRYFLQKKWILVSSLVHESQHLFGLVTIGEEDNPAKRLIHIEAYFNQFKHHSFIKTDSEYRRSTWQTLRDYYLNYLKNVYKEEIKTWKSKFLQLNIPEVK